MEKLQVTLKDAFRLMNLDMVDWPTRDLALLYAQRIDEAGTDKRVLRSVGPELLKTLEALKMTPKSRQTIQNVIKEVASDDLASFNELRERARTRNYPN